MIKLERFCSATTPKVDTCVVPNSILNIGDQSYSLTAAIEHNGMSSTSGHYLTYVRNLSDGGWIKCNDSDISSVSSDKIMLNRDIVFCLYSREFGTPSSTTSTTQREDLPQSPVTYAEKVKRNLPRSGKTTEKTAAVAALSSNKVYNTNFVEFVG